MSARGRRARRAAGVAAFLLAATPGSADAFRVAQLSYQYTPSSELRLSGAEEDEIETTAQSFALRLWIPVLLNGERTLLLNTLTFRTLYQTYDPPGVQDGVFRPDYLFAFRYGLGFRQLVSREWEFAFYVQPGFLSDLDDADPGAFSLRVVLLADRHVSERFTWGLGVAWLDSFGESRVLPVLNLDWRPTPRWEIDVDAPRAVSVLYGAGRLRGGIAAQAAGGDFLVGEDVPLGAGLSTGGGRVKYSTVTVGPTAELGLGGPWRLVVDGGSTVYRRYEVFDEANRPLLDSTFEDSLFLRTSLEFHVDR